METKKNFPVDIDNVGNLTYFEDFRANKNAKNSGLWVEIKENNGKVTNDKNVTKKKLVSSSGGGGGNMTDYATKKELDSAVDRISRQIDTNHKEIMAKMVLSDQRMNHSEEMSNLKLDNQKEAINKIDSRLSTIIGIGITSIAIPILLKLLGY